MNTIRHGLPVFLLFFSVIIVSLSGCASTGRGEFPKFPPESRTGQSLAIITPLSEEGQDLGKTVYYHVNRQKLNSTFKSVKVFNQKSLKELFRKNDSFDEMSTAEINSLEEALGTDLVLTLRVHDFRIEQFTTTETERLDRTETEHRHTDIDHHGNGSGASVRTHESEYSSREIPVQEGNIRVVLSMSATIYDFNEGRVIWSGRRIERAQDELKDLSALELTDIVVERIMYRVISRLTA